MHGQTTLKFTKDKVRMQLAVPRAAFLHKTAFTQLVRKQNVLTKPGCSLPYPHKLATGPCNESNIFKTTASHYLCGLHFNIILVHTPSFRKEHFRFRFHVKVLYAWCMVRPSRHYNGIWWTVLTMRLLTAQFLFGFVSLPRPLSFDNFLRTPSLKTLTKSYSLVHSK